MSDSLPSPNTPDEDSQCEADKLVQRDLIPMGPRRDRLPETREGLTHKFRVGNHEGYLTPGFYEDGRPGELFIHMAKEGSTIGGLMNTIAVLTSLALQYGVPIDALARKFEHAKFEPSGQTNNPDIPQASSVVDYVFRWLGIHYSRAYRELLATHQQSEESPPAHLRHEDPANRASADISPVHPSPDDSFATLNKPHPMIHTESITKDQATLLLGQYLHALNRVGIDQNHCSYSFWVRLRDCVHTRGCDHQLVAKLQSSLRLLLAPTDATRLNIDDETASQIHFTIEYIHQLHKIARRQRAI